MILVVEVLRLNKIEEVVQAEVHLRIILVILQELNGVEVHDRQA